MTAVWLQYGILSLAIGGGLYLFFQLKLELGVLENRHEEKVRELEHEIAAARAALEEFRVALREAQDHAGLLVPPTPPPSGLNLGKRAQALRLHRRGDSPESIAAALGLPRSEVELLVKVHQIVLDHAG